MAATQQSVANRKIVRPAKGMTEKDFKKFAEFIHDECGIKLSASKKTMLEARLQKRLRALGYDDYKKYTEYLFSNAGMENEMCHLIDQVTTNTTDFFREPKHFEYLKNILLPQWMSEAGRFKSLKLWSAGCSIGAEPYTLAVVFSDFQASQPAFKFNILATDISNNVLQKAMKGIYTLDQARGLSKPVMHKYFLKSKDPKKRLIRVAPEVRNLVEFRRLNFMESFSFREQKDIIFCRNVIIYFDKPTQADLLGRFCNNLKLGGHLFIGHSESLAGLNLPLRQVAPTIYKRV